MADSWEDLDSQPHAQSSGQPAPRQAPAGGLNPNANSFSFNPTASTFTPSFAPKPKPPVPTFAAQPAEQQAAPASSQPQYSNADHQTDQVDHASTNGAQAPKAEAPIEPPSEQDAPVTSASAPPDDTDAQNNAKVAPSSGAFPLHIRLHIRRHIRAVQFLMPPKTCLCIMPALTFMQLSDSRPALLVGCSFHSLTLKQALLSLQRQVWNLSQQMWQT